MGPRKTKRVVVVVPTPKMKPTWTIYNNSEPNWWARDDGLVHTIMHKRSWHWKPH